MGWKLWRAREDEFDVLTDAVAFEANHASKRSKRLRWDEIYDQLEPQTEDWIESLVDVFTDELGHFELDSRESPGRRAHPRENRSGRRSVGKFRAECTPVHDRGGPPRLLPAVQRWNWRTNGPEQTCSRSLATSALASEPSDALWRPSPKPPTSESPIRTRLAPMAFWR